MEDEREYLKERVKRLAAIEDLEPLAQKEKVDYVNR